MFTKIIKNRERRSRVPYHIGWTPDIHEKWTEVKGIRKTITDLNKKVKDLEKFPHLDLKLQETEMDKLRQSITAEEEKVEATVKNIQSLRNDSQKVRQEFLKQKAQVAMLYQKGTEEKIIKNIIRHEEVRDDFQRIDWHLERNNRKESTLHIEIPTEEGWMPLS